jgi:hypothetical protein
VARIVVQHMEGLKLTFLPPSPPRWTMRKFAKGFTQRRSMAADGK